MRNTLAKSIAKFSTEGKWNHAETICMYGRDLSEAESVIRFYYEAFDEWGLAMKGKRSLYPLYKKPADDLTVEEFKDLKKQLEQRRETICQIFLDAVDAHDGAKIMELARAVWFFKDKRGKVVDRERILLLFLKTMLDRSGITMTIRQVAEFLEKEDLEAGKKLQIPADGWSALRRKCLQIGIRIKESRKTRRK